LKISYIILVYKDVEALNLIIESLFNQSILPDEIIIAEDGNSQIMSDFISNIKHDNIKIVHTYQDDLGWRKNRSANNAIKNSSGEFLIFNDGDCIPYPQVVEVHKKLARKKTITCGRRVNLGSKYSMSLRDNKIKISHIASNFIKKIFSLKSDKIGEYEEGIYFNPDSWIFKKLKKSRDTNTTLLGCCWGVYKSDLEFINGFDEDFILPTTGCDTDIQRRFEHFGYKFQTCRNSAIVAHLYHKEKYKPQDSIENQKLMNLKKDIFICTNGLKKMEN